MNVTLVYPCLENFGGWNSLGKHHEGCFILHGLPSIAACLEQAGHNVKLLDLRERLSWNDVQSWITHDNSQVYGIYMSTLDYYEAKHVAEIIKQVKPQAKVVVGGPHPSVARQSVSRDSVFDHVFVGEGEITFPEMVEDLDSYPRIVEGEHPDLNKLPYEKREIFNMKKVLATKHPVYPRRFINIISGRSCPFNCLTEETNILLPNFDERSVVDLKIGECLLAFDGEKIVETNIVVTHNRKTKELLRIETENGTVLRLTLEHPVFTKRGWVLAKNLTVNDELLDLSRCNSMTKI